jgi:hypothetical protein
MRPSIPSPQLLLAAPGGYPPKEAIGPVSRAADGDGPATHRAFRPCEAVIAIEIGDHLASAPAPMKALRGLSKKIRV